MICHCFDSWPVYDMLCHAYAPAHVFVKSVFVTLIISPSEVILQGRWFGLWYLHGYVYYPFMSLTCSLLVIWDQQSSNYWYAFLIYMYVLLLCISRQWWTDCMDIRSCYFDHVMHFFETMNHALGLCSCLVAQAIFWLLLHVECSNVMSLQLASY